MKNFNRYALQLSMLLLASFALQVSAQESNGSMAETWYITVDRAHRADFEAAFKANAALRADAGDPRTWMVLTPVWGSHLDTYLVRTCCFSWADGDAYKAWDAEHPEVMQQWNADVDPHVSSYTRNFSQIDLVNSKQGDGSLPYQLVELTSWTISPGKLPAFAAAKAEISQIVLNQRWDNDSDINFTWIESINGPKTVTLAIARENYADMAPKSPTLVEFLTEQMGTESAGALLQRFASATESSNHRLLRLRPDLVNTK